MSTLPWVALIVFFSLLSVGMGYAIYWAITGDDYRDRKGQPWPHQEGQDEENAPV
jgi:hypothetical protein